MPTLNNVRIAIHAPVKIQMLDDIGAPAGERDPIDSAQERSLKARDWAKLRETLVSLDLRNPAQVADWLNEAGYMTSLPEPWNAENLTEGVVFWVRANANIVSWLMGMADKDYTRTIRLSERYFLDLGPYIIAPKVVGQFELALG